MKNQLVLNVKQATRVLFQLSLLGLFTGVSFPLMAEDHHEHGATEAHHDHDETAAHVHGQADLNIVVDGQQIMAEFISPLDNLLGFEHEPVTDEEKQAYQALKQHLSDYQALFSISDAHCKQNKQHIASPFSQAEDVHAEWHGEYYLECSELGESARFSLQLFSVYRGLEQVNVQLISPQGQSQFVVSSDSEEIPLK